MTLSAADLDTLTELLGRAPGAPCEIVVRDPAGAPLVIRNAPFMFDGTPMPTRYWLVDPELLKRVSGLEAAGGVRQAEAEVDPDVLAAAHAAYAAERDAQIAEDHEGPRPFGGVAGTRQGVKCLHAHYAAWLAGTNDPVGAWVDAQLRAPRPTEETP